MLWKPQTTILMVLVALCIFTITDSQRNYCRANLCKGRKHITCGNKGNFKKPCARNARLIQVSGRIRRAIVNRHNYYRNMVARGQLKRFRPAVRMAPMRWNNELARLAALNVKQCVMRHDQCRNTPKFTLSGQNLALTIWNSGNLNAVAIAIEQIQSWFREHLQAKMSDINKLPNKRVRPIGHFTTMMQEKNTHVGCAILRQTKNGETSQLMACNYAYTNIKGKPVYRKGRTGSKCRTGLHRRFKGLCSRNEKYNVRT